MANPLVKVKRRMSNKSLVAIFIAITIAVTLLFSVAVVFAFNQQSISSSVRITYKTVDITGSVTMYAKAGSATEFYKGTDTANKIDEFVFDVETETTETPAQLDLSNAELTKQNNTLYIHYVFENSGQRAYTAILSYLETEVYTQNMELKYSQTGEDGSYIDSNYGLVVAGGSTKDYYVKISVQDLAFDAEFDGMFTWQLNECDEDLTQMEEISLTATTFTVIDETKNTYSAQYNGQDISISGISGQANEGIDNIWYVPSRIGAGKVVSVTGDYATDLMLDFRLPENTKVVIAEGVEFIDRYAFAFQNGLVEISIPNSVIRLESMAFSYIENLTNIILPNSLTSIGEMAFTYCKGLIDVTIPNSVTSIGSSAFSNCSGLTEITIPDSVTSIGSNAFYSCGGLTEITIPDSVISIGYSAFSNCTGLTEITIPKSVISIEDNVFGGCDSLESIQVDKNNVNYIGEGNCLIEKYSKTLIQGCKTSEIPTDGSVTKIGNNAFNDCLGLAEIALPNSIVIIGEGAFNWCTDLTSITIPESVTEIGRCAFQYCTGLTNITIPNSVRFMGGYIFYGCTGLVSITLSQNITAIESFTFTGCSSLTSIIIPEEVARIEGNAFSSCTSLTSIIIPENVTEIGSYAFNGCTSLTEVEFKNTSGWFVSKSSTATSGTSISESNLSNTTTAATYLKSTYTRYYWKRT